MLHCYEFCNELKAVYCDDNNESVKNVIATPKFQRDPGSNSSEYNEDDPIQCAYILKKELDYALSLDPTEKSKALSLSSRDLWKWINDFGLTAVNENSTLRKKISDISLKNELLESELDDYKLQCKEVAMKLDVPNKQNIIYLSVVIHYNLN